MGLEKYFTNELIQNFARSKVALVIKKNVAPVVLYGTVTSVKFIPIVKAEGGEGELRSLPLKSILTTKYSVVIRVKLDLRRSSDQKVIWSSTFKQENVYSAPQLESAIINSANALYNHSAKHQQYAKLAKDMMVEAHDRLTEKF